VYTELFAMFNNTEVSYHWGAEISPVYDIGCSRIRRHRTETECHPSGSHHLSRILHDRFPP
jgi:hypothetical protein